ncbi:M48 metallopeptidase family protein [Halomonas sp. V046]|uniref:M48 metallopeptidase family protein n=1 Tax=Halomonas sp. V046 TaxID=3459611 RepID=UPI0040441BBD
MPRHIAEYVVVHELAHLKEPRHTPAFWRHLERAMPDYEQRKAGLARPAIEVEGV